MGLLFAFVLIGVPSALAIADMMRNDKAEPAKH
ncbi:hypothetical protein N825_02190 [Skermanella stibiiresistens SB22]|jgi:hypothetical protein|uniref:Uncharacterized protein n=1 Tax=Skermanella stibiiresistens SB22 TaxID=1385369 RepID=W9HDR9_9PROT|nr:hypothetical protein N825_02190 [Skermanella stibiiresistens SB22]